MPCKAMFGPPAFEGKEGLPHRKGRRTSLSLRRVVSWGGGVNRKPRGSQSAFSKAGSVQHVRKFDENQEKVVGRFLKKPGLNRSRQEKGRGDHPPRTEPMENDLSRIEKEGGFQEELAGRGEEGDQGNKGILKKRF